MEERRDKETFLTAIAYYFRHSNERIENGIYYPLFKAELDSFIKQGGFYGQVSNVSSIIRSELSGLPGDIRDPFAILLSERSGRFPPVDYTDIDLYEALGYKLTSDDIRRIILRHPTYKEWLALLSRGLDICSVVRDESGEEHDVLSRMLEDVERELRPIGNPSTVYDVLESLHVIDVITSNPACMNQHVGSGLGVLLDSVEQEARYIRPEEDTGALDVIADYIKQVIDTLHNVRRRRPMLEELSFLPASRRFPGGYSTLQHQPGFFNVKEQIDSLIKESRERGEVDSIWNQAVELAGRIGIIPFTCTSMSQGERERASTCKYEALRYIAYAYTVWLEGISKATHLEDLYPFAIFFGITLSSNMQENKALLEGLIIRRSYLLTLDSKWEDILNECNIAGITRVPTSLPSFLMYMQEYSSQL